MRARILLIGTAAGLLACPVMEFFPMSWCCSGDPAGWDGPCEVARGFPRPFTSPSPVSSLHWEIVPWLAVISWALHTAGFAALLTAGRPWRWPARWRIAGLGTCLLLAAPVLVANGFMAISGWYHVTSSVDPSAGSRVQVSILPVRDCLAHCRSIGGGC